MPLQVNWSRTKNGGYESHADFNNPHTLNLHSDFIIRFHVKACSDEIVCIIK